MNDEKSPPSWFDDTIGRLGDIGRSLRVANKSTMAEAIRDLEREVNKGIRAQSLLGMDVWKNDVEPFMAAREQKAAVPPYRPDEDPKTTVQIESRRAYASGFTIAYADLRGELKMWVELGRVASEKLRKLREAENPAPAKSPTAA